MELLFDDVYGLTTIRRPIRTVLDIGAHAGLFTVAARRAFPHATIHAYEPNPAMAPYLRVQASISRSVTFPEAVTYSDGAMQLVVDAQDSVLTRVVPDPNGSIPAVGLATAVARLGGSVDLVKLDCEGGEWEVFRDEETWQHVQHLTMEFHLDFQHTMADLVAAVESIGFSVQHCDSEEPGYGMLRAIYARNAGGT